MNCPRCGIPNEARAPRCPACGQVLPSQPAAASAGVRPAAAGAPVPLSVWAVLLTAAGVAAAVLFVFDPSTSPWMPPCPLFALTGWFCPGCGATRAIHALLHGRIGEALAWNALLVTGLPFLLLAIANMMKESVTGRPLIARRAPAWSIYAIAVLIMLYWMLRNVPAAPFNLLAPRAF